MITLKTLELFLEKCNSAEAEVVKARAEKFDQIKRLEGERAALLDQLKVIAGQMSAINDLINIGEHHAVELPFAGDEIEEMHEKRLEGYKGQSAEEVRRFREDAAYRRESMDIVEQLDEANKAGADKGDNPEVDS